MYNFIHDSVEIVLVVHNTGESLNVRFDVCIKLNLKLVQSSNYSTNARVVILCETSVYIHRTTLRDSRVIVFTIKRDMKRFRRPRIVSIISNPTLVFNRVTERKINITPGKMRSKYFIFFFLFLFNARSSELGMIIHKFSCVQHTGVVGIHLNDVRVYVRWLSTKGPHLNII